MLWRDAALRGEVEAGIVTKTACPSRRVVEISANSFGYRKGLSGMRLASNSHRRTSTVLQWGQKHRGESFDEILRKDPGYIVWFVRTIERAYPSQFDFLVYAVNNIDRAVPLASIGKCI